MSNVKIVHLPSCHEHKIHHLVEHAYFVGMSTEYKHKSIHRYLISISSFRKLDSSVANEC